MNLNPWQLLLWIAGLELISIPLIIFTINAIIIGYFKIKEQHIAKVMNSASNAIKGFVIKEEKKNDN